MHPQRNAGGSPKSSTTIIVKSKIQLLKQTQHRKLTYLESLNFQRPPSGKTKPTFRSVQFRPNLPRLIINVKVCGCLCASYFGLCFVKLISALRCKISLFSHRRCSVVVVTVVVSKLLPLGGVNTFQFPQRTIWDSYRCAATV